MFSEKIREKSIGKMRSMRLLSVLLVPMVALILGAAVPQVWAEDDDDEIPFDVAKLYFELNDSDGDIGIHGLIDGEPWKRLEIEDPRERQMLNIFVQGRLKKQGLTELFFESAEPSFDDQSAEEFFRRFPQGEYEIEGLTLEGDELESEVWLKHRMPAPADVFVNDESIITSGECDEDDDPTEVELPLIIEWNRVTTSHAEIGSPNNRRIKVVLYQVVVEWEDEDENVFIFNAEFPDPGPTDELMSVTVPDEFLEAAGDNEFKVEVLVRAANNNQTAVESCAYEVVE